MYIQQIRYVRPNTTLQISEPSYIDNEGNSRWKQEWTLLRMVRKCQMFSPDLLTIIVRNEFRSLEISQVPKPQLVPPAPSWTRDASITVEEESAIIADENDPVSSGSLSNWSYDQPGMVALEVSHTRPDTSTFYYDMGEHLYQNYPGLGFSSLEVLSMCPNIIKVETIFDSTLARRTRYWAPSSADLDAFENNSLWTEFCAAQLTSNTARGCTNTISRITS